MLVISAINVSSKDRFTIFVWKLFLQQWCKVLSHTPIKPNPERTGAFTRDPAPHPILILLSSSIPSSSLFFDHRARSRIRSLLHHSYSYSQFITVMVIIIVVTLLVMIIHWYYDQWGNYRCILISTMTSISFCAIPIIIFYYKESSPLTECTALAWTESWLFLY